MYNTYQGPPGQYSRQQTFSGYPGQQNAPPGMGPPPGMGAPPSASPAPGMQHIQPPQQGGFPPNFQPPANMQNINFSAPVIRLGTGGPPKPETPTGGGPGVRNSGMEQSGNRRGTGLGFDGRNQDQQRNQMREQMMALQPPSREEIARTIFIGNIVGLLSDDESIRRVLDVPGGLRRWTRCMDAESKLCSFGFAEYEDADSLGTAIDILKDLEIPNKKAETNGTEDGDDAEDKKQLLVMVDENSRKYIDEWRGRGKDESEMQFRVDSAKEDLSSVMASLARGTAPDPNADIGTVDLDGDTAMPSYETKMDAETGEVVTIPIQAEDELSDIPAEMRETVAKEIAAFRDRSNRRDMERLRREEEMEQAERQRHGRGAASAGAGANGIPVGPRDRSGVEGAPLGPKGFGVQVPRDYQKGVAFVNGSGVNGTNGTVSNFTAEEEDSDADDEELERRRQEKRNAELEKAYLDQERRWMNREKSRTAAVQRQKESDKDEASNLAKEKEKVAARLKEWDDDVESSRDPKEREEYYVSRSRWLQNRRIFREREVEQDERDRAAERREKARENDRKAKELGMADQFLAQTADVLDRQPEQPRAEPARFKMSLGNAAQKAEAATAPRRTMAEVEGFLEDEEDAQVTGRKRELIPIQYDSSMDAAGMTEEERAQAAKQLATEIPTDKEGLWNWNIKWDFVEDSIISEQLRPFVEKKILEYLGVQEQMLVDVVEETVRKRGNPQTLVGELEEALDEEAEALVKKLWRMLIFFSESEKRGLSQHS